jgi:hypothetical protein
VVWFSEGPLQYRGPFTFPDASHAGNAVKELNQSHARSSVKVLSLGAMALLSAVYKHGGAVLSLAPWRERADAQGKFGDCDIHWVQSDLLPPEAIALPKGTTVGVLLKSVCSDYAELAGVPLEETGCPGTLNDFASIAMSHGLQELGVGERALSPRRTPSWLAAAAGLALAAAGVFQLSQRGGDRSETELEQSLGALRMPPVSHEKPGITQAGYGRTIPRASDDAAGLAIADSLRDEHSQKPRQHPFWYFPSYPQGVDAESRLQVKITPLTIERKQD